MHAAMPRSPNVHKYPVGGATRFSSRKMFGGWGGGTAQHEAPYDFLEGMAHAHCKLVYTKLLVECG